jgi:hypothetical protein
MAKGMRKAASGKYEGSAKDEKRDAQMAKKKGIPMKKWEGSKADKKMDKAGQKAMNKRK